MRFCLTNRLIVVLFTACVVAGGLLMAPFDWSFGGLQRYPVPVDAIPDIGENQQIVFTEWTGRSPQDVEDQVTYPLTVQLLGIPGVKTVRSFSMFGFSTVYVIFKENVEFYWSRIRLLEKINSLHPELLPPGVKPTLGPDATALGQIYWYTLEGLDPRGDPTGGWSQEELRSVQDWYVRYNLLAADGVAEVASAGGYVREYQIDVDPDAMRAYGVTIEEVYEAAQNSNMDIGANSIEVNRIEYFIRGVGFVKTLADLENSVVKAGPANIPVLIKNVAEVSFGPASRRGALDKDGAPAVGGVVVARYGDNPLKVISNVNEQINAIRDSLPSKAIIDHTVASSAEAGDFAFEQGFKAFDEQGLPNQEGWLSYLRATPQEEWPAWLTLSKLTIVPFYDRTGLIYETLGTLNEAISLEMIITVIVVLVMVVHVRSSLIISSTLPLAVLMCFIGMKLFNVQANIVALSGIAIAIGTIVDMGIIISENILRHLAEADPDEPKLEVVHRASSEVGGAVLTAVITTIVSFLPVFTMSGAEGKLFKPLAFTKTFALIASVIAALTIIPVAAYTFFDKKKAPGKKPRTLRRLSKVGTYAITALAVLVVGAALTSLWEPLGPEKGLLRNAVPVVAMVGGLLGLMKLFQHFYPSILAWCLDHKLAFLSIPAFILLFGLAAWLGFERVFAWLPGKAGDTRIARYAAERLPGLGKEFMPDLDEGSFLYMPTTMPHASIGEVLDIMSKQDMAFRAIPEVESVVGKLGRSETPLDPAPISMLETVINYKPEYISDKNGKRLRFRYENGEFPLDTDGDPIPDPKGRPFRQWRPHILTPDDIWSEIVEAGKMPGITSAPKLQPIAARIVMLQSGMRAPMGVKVKGPGLEDIEKVGIEIERHLKEVPGVEASAVIADRMVGQPYLEIVPDRGALARYGISIAGFQNTVEIAIGGRKATDTVEGRERYPVRVRYNRELRDNIEDLDKILVAGADGAQIPIAELAEIRYVRGPQMIQSEDTFLIGYVVFDKEPHLAEVDVVERARDHLRSKIDSGEFVLPPGTSYEFAGSYENRLRAARTLALVMPVALISIFLLIYFEFRSIVTTGLIFTGVFVAWAGGFILLWLYAQPWFLDFAIFGKPMRELFQVGVVNLSVAVWVGFLALFGIATDDGVVMGTYLTQVFRENNPTDKTEIRRLVVLAGSRRVRACLMTTATTVLALLPVLTSTGRGSDIMVPMAIPSFGGMTIEIITMLIVPVLYSLHKELRLRRTAPPARVE